MTERVRDWIRPKNGMETHLFSPEGKSLCGTVNCSLEELADAYLKYTLTDESVSQGLINDAQGYEDWWPSVCKLCAERIRVFPKTHTAESLRAFPKIHTLDLDEACERIEIPEGEESLEEVDKLVEGEEAGEVKENKGGLEDFLRSEVMELQSDKEELEELVDELKGERAQVENELARVQSELSRHAKILTGLCSDMCTVRDSIALLEQNEHDMKKAAVMRVLKSFIQDLLSRVPDLDKED